MLGHQLVFPRALAAPMKPRNRGVRPVGPDSGWRRARYFKALRLPLRGTAGDGEKPARAVYPCWP